MSFVEFEVVDEIPSWPRRLRRTDDGHAQRASTRKKWAGELCAGTNRTPHADRLREAVEKQAVNQIRITGEVQIERGAGGEVNVGRICQRGRAQTQRPGLHAGIPGVGVGAVQSERAGPGFDEPAVRDRSVDG